MKITLRCLNNQRKSLKASFQQLTTENKYLSNLSLASLKRKLKKIKKILNINMKINLDIPKYSDLLRNTVQGGDFSDYINHYLLKDITDLLNCRTLLNFTA